MSEPVQWVAGVMHTNRFLRLPVERLSGLSPTATYVPGTHGLACPYCGERSVVRRESRVYVCVNPDCRGMAVPCWEEAPCKWASRLMVSGGGCYLEPWDSSVRIDRMRLTDPRSLVARELRSRSSRRVEVG